jgi:uncharacterized protein
MLSILPKLINPWFLARHNKNILGFLPLDKLNRLEQVIIQSTKYKDVNVELIFTMNEQRQILISGNVKTKFLVMCQRCLSPMQWNINHNIKLYLLNSKWSQQKKDEISDTLINYESLEINFDEESISLFNLIEDDLLLNMPLVTKHEVCANNKYIHDNDEEIFEDSVRENPFKILNSFKQ